MSGVGEWKALGRAVTSRRVELGFDRRDDFASTAGIGSRTIGEIERGEEKGYRDSLIARLEKALQWPPGAVRSIVDGGDPPPPGSRTIYVEGDRDAAYLQAVQDRPADEPDPLEAKLERLQLLASGLNPSDARRLADSVQLLLEWVDARLGVPEMTDDERRALEDMQRAANAHNRAIREHRAAGAPTSESGRAVRGRS